MKGLGAVLQVMEGEVDSQVGGEAREGGAKGEDRAMFQGRIHF